jgi:chemotaxis protein MotA
MLFLKIRDIRYMEICLIYYLKLRGMKINMNFSVIIFLVTGFASLIVAFLIDGGHLHSLLSETAAMIVFGGTIGAVGVSTPAKDLKRIPAIIGVIFKAKSANLSDLIIFFKELSVRTRKNGLLTIESELTSQNIDRFIKKGLQLVVDGIEPATIQGILELDVESIAERHRRAAGIFEAAGGYAPTMGIVGTVMGLVHVLGNLSDPSSLGPAIAVAFIATLYGISSANLLWLPIAANLKALDEEEFVEKRLTIEAILLIQLGASPNTLAEKLKGFLDKKELVTFESTDKGISA